MFSLFLVFFWCFSCYLSLSSSLTCRNSLSSSRNRIAFDFDDITTVVSDPKPDIYDDDIWTISFILPLQINSSDGRRRTPPPVDNKNTNPIQLMIMENIQIRMCLSIFQTTQSDFDESESSSPAAPASSTTVSLVLVIMHCVFVSARQ